MIFFVTLVFISSTLVSANSVNIKPELKNFNTKSDPLSAKWTVMIYLDGDNNLESYAIDNFLAMAAVGSTSNVKIVVEFDRIPGYDSRYGDWTTTKRYCVTDGMVPDAASALQDIGEANMGDPQTLISFVTWAKGNYPASHYCLILWDHGGGWKYNTGLRKYVCDDETDGDMLETSELGYAMNVITGGGANKTDLLGFDACLMQMIEIGYQVKDYVKYMTGSEQTEPASGWNYESGLAALVASPNMTAKELGAKFVNYYTGTDITLSTVNIGQFDNLAQLVSDLGQILQSPNYKDGVQYVMENVQRYEDYDYVDLYHFAQLVSEQINDDNVKSKAQAVMYAINSVVTSEKHDDYVPDSHGISIYAPYYNYDQAYDDLIFSQNTQWDEFIKWYFGDPGNNKSPLSPIITGPYDGTIGTEYTYNFTSTDPEGDDVQYYVEWGDYSVGEWFGPFHQEPLVAQPTLGLRMELTL